MSVINLNPKIRLSVLRILSNKLAAPTPEIATPTIEVLALNAIILEYFEWIGLRRTSQMFREESNIALSELTKEGNHSLNLVREMVQSRRELLPVIFTLIDKMKTRNYTSL